MCVGGDLMDEQGGSKCKYTYSLAFKSSIKVPINYNLGVTLLSKVTQGQQRGQLHLREIFLS